MSRLPTEDDFYLAALAHFPPFGPKRLARIIEHFPRLKTAFNSTLAELNQAGIEEKAALAFLAARPKISLQKIEDMISRESVGILTLKSSAYPRLLKEIYAPPAVLFYKGDLGALLPPKAAVVGTRRPTAYGLRAAEKICSDLAESGILIASGLAIGIDTIAHRTAVRKKSPTIAVLGTGLNDQAIYPAANRRLAQEIIQERGLILSEFPFNAPALAHHFPQRNRIIAGLAKATIVIEAAVKSGALITARLALEQNREVFSLPGSIFSPFSQGPNLLIKDGARPLIDTAELLEIFGREAGRKEAKKSILPLENELEKAIFSHLSTEATHVNDLVRLTNQPVSAINSTLTLMEIKGLIKNAGNMSYILI